MTYKNEVPEVIYRYQSVGDGIGDLCKRINKLIASVTEDREKMDELERLIKLPRKSVSLPKEGENVTPQFSLEELKDSKAIYRQLHRTAFFLSLIATERKKWADEVKKKLDKRCDDQGCDYDMDIETVYGILDELGEEEKL